MADFIKLRFFIRYSTVFGESLWISGNLNELGNDDPAQAVSLTYLDNELWHGTVLINAKKNPFSFRYKYFLKIKDGELIWEWGNDRSIDASEKKIHELHLVDVWNHVGEFENVFFTAPFRKTLLKTHAAKQKTKEPKNFTHIFKIKAPLLAKNDVPCLLGGCDAMGNWSKDAPILLTRADNWWTVKLNLKQNGLPIPYKYGVYNTKEKKFLHYEGGNNRILYSDAVKKKISILHDGFIYLANNTWKGAGVAIPVFSLRSKNSFGVGEFTDLKLLVDWARSAGLKLIQLLPVNDTTATHTWKDSYPYAAISAFALHPIYINLSKVAGKEYAKELKPLKQTQKELNELPELDYEKVMKVKSSALKELFAVMKDECFESDDYKSFYNSNKYWLVPYAAFCFFRDKYGTSDFQKWKNNAVYDEKEIKKLAASDVDTYYEIHFHYFVQYHLHIQLKEAADYAHAKGVVLKGDIPIGVSRNGCDAWVAPDLFNMEWHAGAPPDEFTAIGQNWGFPTYNWKKMQEDGFTWWKQRFGQMSNYFDAFRIDHILGFFRIWSIPASAVQGILGRFIPAIPVHISEFGENGIWFDHRRYCLPYINEDILNAVFYDLAEKVKADFVIKNEFGGYDLKPELETQRQAEAFFANLETTEENERLKNGLYDLISNVILLEDKNSDGKSFHFRISMEHTHTYYHLNPHLKEKLKALYINYFYQRQDDFWAKEAMHKLPQLKATTDMLVCGEDLGMVPHCVPDVMKQLGKEFFIPDEAPYLSVVTPSTHDMSIVREWWEGDRNKTQRFFNNVLGQKGDAPLFCEPWVNRAIILQHLYSPAMWSIFQLQDILGMSEALRWENPKEERINNPANQNHYWRYRLHHNLEDLQKAKDFITELKDYITHSGR